jgi:hypothetical protein
VSLCGESRQRTRRFLLIGRESKPQTALAEGCLLYYPPRRNSTVFGWFLVMALNRYTVGTVLFSDPAYQIRMRLALE